MSNQTVKLPTDIFAIKAIGIKCYQDHYSWPISDQQFFFIADSIFHAFDDLCSELEPAERGIILSDIYFPIILINHIHALSVSKACKNENREIVVGELQKSFYVPDWRELGLKIDSDIRSQRWWHYQLRRYEKNLVFNSHLNIFRQIYGVFLPDTLGLGSTSRIRQEYLIKNNISIDNHYWVTLLGQCDFDYKDDIEDDFIKRVQKFFNNLEAFCSDQLSVTFDSSAAYKSWMMRLKSLRSIYNFLLKRGPTPKLFLMTQPGSSINKLVAHALKQKGAKTITFEHGNAFGGLVVKSTAYNGPVNCDEYVCPTTGSADSFRFMYEQTAVSRFHQVNFTSIETEYYHTLWKQSQTHSFPEKIKKVMLMGHAMTPTRYIGPPGILFYLQFDLELRLMNFLKKKGFEVLYQIHPHTMQIAGDFFKSLEVEISSELFEKVWHLADCFIFKFTPSTTFHFALCTNRPMFLLDQEKDYWQPDHYQLLSKRCRMIPAWTDERNRIQFDEDRLSQELSDKPECPDFDYVHKYMFPKSRQ